MKRLCTICKIKKDESEFFKNVRAADGLQKHCKPCHRQMTIRWVQKNPEKSVRIMKNSRERYKQRHADRIPELRRKLYAKHGKRWRANEKMRYQALRKEVIDAYGGKCACCAEQMIEFLSLDHVNNDGALHRTQVHPGSLPRWAKRNNYPDTLQALCFNCNMGRFFSGRSSGDFTCPHKLKGD